MKASELNEISNALLNLKKLSEESEATRDRDNEQLELGLQELRIVYNRLDKDHNQVKIRIITFVGAGLALLSYLYGGGDLFIPQETYGRVFYFVGAGLSITGISFLLHALRPSYWSVPIETKIDKLFRTKSKNKLLNLLIEEYQESMQHNIVRYEQKINRMHSGFFQLLCGGIILLVIKSIGA